MYNDASTLDNYGVQLVPGLIISRVSPTLVPSNTQDIIAEMERSADWSELFVDVNEFQ